jgi:PPIC-type PPIASE domain
MTRYGLVCLLFAGLAWGQADSNAARPQLATRPPDVASQASGAKPAEADQPDISKVSPTSPVITIDGLCDNPPADKTAAGDCKTVITREQFETILNAIQQPNMPVRAKRQFATRYAAVLVMAQKAHDMGLDKGPEFEEQMSLMRLQVLSRELNRSVQDKASQISDKEVEDYYNGHKSDFEEADLYRIVIPKNQQGPASKAKLSDADEQKRTQQGQETMKALADKLHARAVAGEDFTKLQEEAFQTAGVKTKAPSVSMNDVRRNGLPPTVVSVMDLKEGEVSQVFPDVTGFVIYKVKKKETEPLDKMKEEIRGNLRAQRMQEAMQNIEHSATTSLDDSYFGPAVGGPPGISPARSQPPTRPN